MGQVPSQSGFNEIRWLADMNAQEIAKLMSIGVDVSLRADIQRDALYVFTKSMTDGNADLLIDLYDEEFLAALVRHSSKKAQAMSNVVDDVRNGKNAM